MRSSYHIPSMEVSQYIESTIVSISSIFVLRNNHNVELILKSARADLAWIALSVYMHCMMRGGMLWATASSVAKLSTSQSAASLQRCRACDRFPCVRYRQVSREMD